MRFPSLRLRARGAATLVLATAASAPALAAVPAGFVQRTLVSGPNAPTAMAFAPDGRLFVCQQGGALRVIREGRLLATPFVQLTVDFPADSERGLLGVALDPDFGTTPYVYVYYTVPGPGVHNRISRFLADGDVSTGSEQILLELNPLSSATNHNGGALHFGADGKLYAAVGENANGANSQTLANLLGKMLRLNKDGSIPSDNPFFITATGNNRAIWALGLRNPFTFAFDAAGTRMFINDVGQNTWEEINDGRAGANYGWNIEEGVANNPLYVDPLLAYAHGSTAATGCAIAGGLSTTRPRCPGPRGSPAITSTPTCAADGSAASTPRSAPLLSRPGSRPPWTWPSGRRATSTTWRAGRAVSWGGSPRTPSSRTTSRPAPSRLSGGAAP